MEVRYKKTGTIAHASRFNMSALAEVLTGDDSTFIKELDVLLVFPMEPGREPEWKDMNDAFRDHDLIEDNYATYFFEPTTLEDKKRGYTE